MESSGSNIPDLEDSEAHRPWHQKVCGFGFHHIHRGFSTRVVPPATRVRTHWDAVEKTLAQGSKSWAQHWAPNQHKFWRETL